MSGGLVNVSGLSGVLVGSVTVLMSGGVVVVGTVDTVATGGVLSPVDSDSVAAVCVTVCVTVDDVVPCVGAPHPVSTARPMLNNAPVAAAWLPCSFMSRTLIWVSANSLSSGLLEFDDHSRRTVYPRPVWQLHRIELRQ
jgi:hypothetical protein